MPDPMSVHVRTYQVGFGDCFLLTIAYDDGSEKHVLIDFGSMARPPDAPSTRMMDIAQNIRDRCGGKLTAVVATHRHQDHISGFKTDSRGRGPGAVIAALDPDLVVQPWTEHPDLPVDAVAPGIAPGRRAMALQAVSLAAMQAVSANYVTEASRNNAYLRSLGKNLRKELAFIGQDNIANLPAVNNLIAMGHEKGRGEYLHAGSTTQLAGLLGVEIDVLGPPTVQQSAAIRNQRPRDNSEFWQLAAAAPGAIDPGSSAKAKPLFPDHVQARENGNFPIEARWLIYRTRAMRGNQMLQIVRMLDGAMNNTSLILLFRIGSKSLLFPGDAQIENWEYAFTQAEWMNRLSEVDLYKVGHHGSLNATPKTLWAQFAKKSEDPTAAGRLDTLMSTLEEIHGHAEADTEVPRMTLVTELKKQSNFFTTQSLDGQPFWYDSVLDVR